MIRGDAAVEEIFYWEAGQTLENKNEPKLPGTGVHLVTGPIEVAGAEVGDVVEVEILELDPRYNPATGRCFGTNSQKFAGYQFRVGNKRDGTKYVTSGGTEAITVFEFIEDDGKFHSRNTKIKLRSMTVFLTHPVNMQLRRKYALWKTGLHVPFPEVSLSIR
jgi:hypothetical protein